MEETWRLIGTPPAPGAWNMGCDQALAEAVGSDVSPPVLRLYGWSVPTLSVGYGQPLASRRLALEALRGRGIHAVRRPTGGGAVLHEDELTYAVVLPSRRGSAPGGTRRLCARVHEAIGRGLEELGVEGLELAREAPRRLLAAGAGYGVGGGAPAAERAASHSGLPGAGWRPPSPAGACFAQTSPSELAWRGRKLVGSAQRRLAGAMLQHGSLPLAGERPELRELWLDAPRPGEAATLRQAAGRAVDAGEAGRALRAGFEAVFAVTLEPGSLTPAEQERAGCLARERYGREEFLYRL